MAWLPLIEDEQVHNYRGIPPPGGAASGSLCDGPARHRAAEKELGIHGMRFHMDLNEREFANGMSGEKVTIPRFGSQMVNVELVTGIGCFLRQFQGLNKTGAGRIRYRLKGSVFVEAPSSFKWPFDEKGEIDLGIVEIHEQRQ